MLDEKIRSVVELYPLEVTAVSRGRGAFVCQTSQGLKLLKAYPYSENHLIYESMLKSALIDRGFLCIDSFLYNKEGQLLTPGRDGQNYVLKNWYEGQECDLKDRRQVETAVQTMARLHQVMKNIHFECSWMQHADARPLDEVFSRRMRELRGIRSYIRGKKNKNAFEQAYINAYDFYIGQASHALELLTKADYGTMFAGALADGVFCHGDFSHHHILIGKNSAAVINFDKSVRNLQIQDLYYFLRKAMEKCGWDISAGIHILKAYETVRKLTAQEKECLYAMFVFPEKYWKTANHYFNSRKSWFSEQNMEKLKKFISQTKVRQQFLEVLETW